MPKADEETRACVRTATHEGKKGQEDALALPEQDTKQEETESVFQQMLNYRKKHWPADRRKPGDSEFLLMQAVALILECLGQKMKIWLWSIFGTGEAESLRSFGFPFPTYKFLDKYYI